MALRRPTLLICIVTIVLGVHYEVSQPLFSGHTDPAIPVLWSPPSPGVAESALVLKPSTRPVLIPSLFRSIHRRRPRLRITAGDTAGKPCSFLAEMNLGCNKATRAVDMASVNAYRDVYTVGNVGKVLSDTHRDMCIFNARLRSLENNSTNVFSENCTSYAPTGIMYKIVTTPSHSMAKSNKALAVSAPGDLFHHHPAQESCWGYASPASLSASSLDEDCDDEGLKHPLHAVTETLGQDKREMCCGSHHSSPTPTEAVTSHAPWSSVTVTDKDHPTQSSDSDRVTEKDKGEMCCGSHHPSPTLREAVTSHAPWSSVSVTAKSHPPPSSDTVTEKGHGLWSSVTATETSHACNDPHQPEQCRGNTAGLSDHYDSPARPLHDRTTPSNITGHAVNIHDHNDSQVDVPEHNLQCAIAGSPSSPQEYEKDLGTLLETVSQNELCLNTHDHNNSQVDVPEHYLKCVIAGSPLSPQEHKDLGTVLETAPQNDLCLNAASIKTKELQPNGTDYRCETGSYQSKEENLNFSYYYWAEHNSSYFQLSVRGGAQARKTTMSGLSSNLSLVSLCIALMVCGNGQLKGKMMAMLSHAVSATTSIRNLLQESMKNLHIDDLKGLGMPRGLTTPVAVPFVQGEEEGKIPTTYDEDSRFGHTPRFLGEQQEASVTAEPSGNNTGHCWCRKEYGGLGEKGHDETHRGGSHRDGNHRDGSHHDGNQCNENHHDGNCDDSCSEKGQDNKPCSLPPPVPCVIPTRPVVITAFPVSFLPQMGSSLKDTMSHLGCRLASLSALPASCDISRVRLAQVGFYYDTSKMTRDAGDVHEVVCYTCGVTYGQWKAGDNPDTIHRRLSPHCQHLNHSSGADSGFFSSVSSAKSSSSLQFPSRSSVSCGHSSESFQPSSQSSGSVADSGHPSAGGPRGPADHVSSPLLVTGAPSTHYSSDLATDCAAVLPTPVTSSAPSGNQSSAWKLARDSANPVTPSSSNHSSSLGSRDASVAMVQEMEDRPPLSMDIAVYPQFSRVQERRATFTGWPLSQYFPPYDLVNQGFYFAGYADCIRCFYCGVGLKSWAETDDVMQEHIRWRPTCGYVLNTKGRHFVNSVMQRIQANSIAEQNNQATISNQGSAASRPSGHPSTKPPSSNGTRNTAVTSGTATVGSATAGSATVGSATGVASAPSAASSPAGGTTASKEVLRAVQDMGFAQEQIARAVRLLQQAGGTKVTADMLADKILEMDTAGPNNNTTTSQRDIQTDGPEEALTTQPSRLQTLRQDNERLRARQTCSVCRSARVGMIFLPCGHVCTCPDCGAKIKKCNRCGESIKATANVFLS